MFGNFKRLADGLQALVSELGQCNDLLKVIAQAQAEHGDVEPRLGELERTLHQQVAEAEALVMKAESTFKAARAAEERERHHAEKAQKKLEELEQLAEEELDPFERAAATFSQINGEGSEGDGVPPVRRSVEARESSHQAAKRMKFGG